MVPIKNVGIIFIYTLMRRCIMKERGEIMLITHKIEKTHFSPSEAIIIEYILDQGENIKDLSINAIAQATYTSPPLLIRIAKKLGYAGWNAFKEAFLEELEYLYATNDIDASIPFVVSDDFMVIAHNIAQLEIESIQDTIKLIHHDDLQKVMRILRDAKEIDIYAVSNHVLLAEEFAEKLFLIHQNVHICRLPGDGKLQAAMSDQDHCAILVSYSGQTEFILEVADILIQKGTPIIAITSIADNDLFKKSDVALRISSREMLHTKIGDFSSSQSVKTILDILYGCLFSLNYQKNLDDKIRVAKEIDDKFSGFEYIDEE